MLRVLALSAALGAASARDLSLKLTKVSQTTSPRAKCIDGTAPAYYWRDGVADGAKSAVLFLEGGGWCYPSEVLQSTGANCAYRAKSGLGSSKGYDPSIASMGYEGGTGYTSGLPNVTKWANWATAYVTYCDGGSMTGTRATSTPARNGTGPLWYRGHYNIVAQLDSMVATKGLATYKEIILSGCSAGGMACCTCCLPVAVSAAAAADPSSTDLKCEFVSTYFAKHSIPVKCICDAGLFLDVDTVTGAGNVMQKRYHDIANVMESKPGLSPSCLNGETMWQQCMFSEHSLKYSPVPTFVINSLYNFGEWAQLAPIYPPGTFPPDTGTPPKDWLKCYPANGQLTPTSYKLCNATQKTLIQGFRKQFIEAISVVVDPKTPHGCFVDSCPNQHCQTSSGWNQVVVNGKMMRDAAADWYFKNSTEKSVDAPFAAPTVNPTCGFHKNQLPMCNNCANGGLGSNCPWSEATQRFTGLDGK